MQSCIKILHFLLNGGPCLTKTKQSDQLDEYQQVKMVKMAKFIKTGKENSSSLSMLYFQSDRIMYSYFAVNFWKVHKVLKCFHRSQCSLPLSIKYFVSMTVVFSQVPTIL